VDFYHKPRSFLEDIVSRYQIIDESIEVLSARSLSPEEAIGHPERRDFPLLKGKEVMIEAVFRQSRGQAYTDMPGDFNGSIRELLSLSLADNFQRAVFISGFNALMRHFGYVSNTVHCRHKEPGICASQLPGFVKKLYGNPKITFVGFQPAMLERLSRTFDLRVIDLDRDNIGRKRFGLIVEGPEKTEEALSWGDIILATGSTCVNATINRLLNRRPVIFYGVSIAGMAWIHGLRRYCPCAH
jgi:hypothetical protein